MPDRLDLVAAGLRPAAILNPEDPAEALARAASLGLVAVAGDPLSEDHHERLAKAPGRVQVYVAPTEEAARHVLILDRVVRGADAPEIPRQSHALGSALGYPDCCSWAYPHTAFEISGEGELLRWARNFLWRAGPGRLGPWSPWLNFHAAHVFGLEFFEHLPCCPWCRSTRDRNHALVAALYDEAQAAAVRDALSQSALLWPDGRFLPFLCAGIRGHAVQVADAGVLRGSLKPHFTARALTEVPGRPGAVSGIRLGQRGLEVEIRGRWARLQRGGREPVLLAFSPCDASTGSAPGAAHRRSPGA